MLTGFARSATRRVTRRPLQRLLAFAATVALVVASCRDVTVTAVDVYRVDIDPPTAKVEVGRSVRFQATVRDEAGNVLERTVVWNSSAPTVLQVSNTGEALGVVAGSAKVTASVEGHSASADVTVEPRPVATVEIVPPDATMLVDDTVAFQAIAKDSDGTVLSGRAAVWISGNPSVVSLSVDGRAIGLAPGVTTVIADVEGVRGQANVSVRARVVLAVAAVTIVPSSATLAEGDSLGLAAVVTAADGTVLTGRTVIWTSDAPGTVSVTPDGRVRALAVGSATIRATAEGVSGTATISVTAIPVASVTVSPSTSSLFVGDTVRLQATVRSVRGTVLTGRRVTWTSSAPQVATVDGTGLVTGVGPGTATMTASVDGVSGTAAVSVSAKPVARVRISPTAPAVDVGDPLTLTALLTASDSSVLTGRLVAWSSSNPSVATVASNGPATQTASVAPQAQGTALITAVAEGISDTTTVTVVFKPVATVSVVPASLTLVAGGTAPVSAEMRASDGTLLTGRTVTWTTADPTIATVVGRGPLQQTADVTAGVCPAGQTSCSTSVTATSEGVAAAATVTVQAGAATVDIVPVTATVAEGATAAFDAVVKDASGTVLPNYIVTWSASPAGLLSVTPVGPFGQTASVTTGACPVGSPTCAATLTASVGAVSGSAAVTIRKVAASVAVAPVADTVYEGGQAKFTATATAADGTPLPASGVAWSSSGAPVTLAPAGADVTVTAGLCPAGSGGHCAAIITATVDGVPGSATLAIDAAVASVIIEPPADTVLELGAGSFTAVLLSAAGDTLRDRTVAWASTDSALALPQPAGPFGATATVVAGSCPTGVPTCSATITATAEGQSATAALVVQKAVSTVTVSLLADTLYESGTTQAVALVLAADGTVITGRAVTWTVTKPFATATPATVPGTADVTATACNPWSAGTTDPDADEDCDVTVVATVDGVSSVTPGGLLTVLKPVASIAISPRPVGITGSQQFTAVLTAADGTPILQRVAQIQWAVTQGVSMTVSPTTGATVTITVVTFGISTIEARITDNGNTVNDSLTLITA